MATAYVVRYRVRGFDGERRTEVYMDERAAEDHAVDIRGYEGVEYAVVDVIDTWVDLSGDIYAGCANVKKRCARRETT